MIRHLEQRDYDPVSTVIDEWWGGRKMSHLLPRIFIIHFRPTSFAIEDGGSVIGFLAGFVLQTNPEQAYIPFRWHSPSASQAWFGQRTLQVLLRLCPGPGGGLRKPRNPGGEGGSDAYLAACSAGRLEGKPGYKRAARLLRSTPAEQTSFVVVERR